MRPESAATGLRSILIATAVAGVLGRRVLQRMNVNAFQKLLRGTLAVLGAAMLLA